MNCTKSLPPLRSHPNYSAFIAEIVRCYTQTLQAFSVNKDQPTGAADGRMALMRSLIHHVFQYFLGNLEPSLCSVVFVPLDAAPPCDDLAEKLLMETIQPILKRYSFQLRVALNDTALTPDVLSPLLEALLDVGGNQKTTLRKQTGAFYTPPEIAVRMIDDALAVGLAKALGQTRLPAIPNSPADVRGSAPIQAGSAQTSSTCAEDWLRWGLQHLNEICPLSSETKAALVEAIAHLTVLDPACGAGVFLLGMLQRLTALLRWLDPDNNLWRIQQQHCIQQIANPQECSRAMAVSDRIFGSSPPDFARQFYLLQRCLYGVDIQAIAVEVAQMRCHLKLCEAADGWGLKDFPDLRKRFVAADSLLGTADVFHRNCSKGFAPKGFDIVITNPPHLDSEAMARSQPRLRTLYAATYATARGNWDLSVVFVERGLQLLKSCGVLSYLVPNKLVSAAYAQPLRELLRQHRMVEICDYATVKTFHDADAYAMTILLQKDGAQTEVRLSTLHEMSSAASCGLLNPTSPAKTTQTQQICSDTFYRDSAWDRYFISQPLLNLLEKCAAFPSLQTHSSMVLGAATVNEAYALKPFIRTYSGNDPAHKKLVNTGTLDPYRTRWATEPIRYLGNHHFQPIVLDTDLKRWSDRRYQQAASPKLIVAGLGKRLECVYDAGEYLAGKSTLIILGEPNNLKYLLGILNSRLISFWYRTSYRSLQMSGGYFRVGKTELKTIPIPDVERSPMSFHRELQDAIVDAVDQLLNNAEDISAPMSKIDCLVEELYGLTESERLLLSEWEEKYCMVR